jgi:cytochrome c peroxidase
MLRDLAPRTPYFHNGFAADLNAVVDFYDTRFNIKFTKQEKTDLVAILRSLFRIRPPLANSSRSTSRWS